MYGGTYREIGVQIKLVVMLRNIIYSRLATSVFTYVLQDKKQGGSLYLHLRHQSKKYRKRYGSSKKNSSIKKRIFIDDRTKIVDSKARIGD